jgi:hypothetical protein
MPCRALLARTGAAPVSARAFPELASCAVSPSTSVTEREILQITAGYESKDEDSQNLSEDKNGTMLKF